MNSYTPCRSIIRFLSASPWANRTRVGTVRHALWFAPGLLFALLVTLLAAPVFAQRDLQDIPVPDPEHERSELQLADGFEISLYAADPEIASPIQMNFDPQGRLWIASSSTYPHIAPGAEADDKVLLIEDRDGDGFAERSTIFARGLLIPTGIAPGDGGVYVANSTELIHLSDTDGDGVADRRRVVLSGFGTEDTHHILHTLRWGPDGMLYFNQSIYIHSHLETPWGVRRLNAGGVWQLRPESLALEVFVRGFVNPWGHDFDRWGQSFGTDGAGGQGINYLLPGASYVTAAGASRLLSGLNPGSPKYCGAEIVDGRHLPEDWQGNILTADFRANRVCRFVLSDDGAGFAAQQMPDLVGSTNVAFRPVDIKQGPDGAIYIADWYNPIIQHGEVDFRDPRRDHVHGRIWRITRKDSPLVQRPRLVTAPTSQLLSQLQSPEGWTRQQAKRVLRERGDAILPELAQWTAALDPADPDYEHHRLEALWTYQSLDIVEPILLESLLTASDPRARAAAVRVMQHWHPRLDNPLDLLANAVNDAHPRVRLEAVRTLATIQETQSMELALRALDRPVDQFLDYALWLTARDLKQSWLPALETGQFNLDIAPEHLEFALRAIDSPAVVAPLLKLVVEGHVPAERQGAVLSLVASLGDAQQLTTVLDLALDEDAASDVQQRARLLDALVKAARTRDVRPSGDLQAIVALLSSEEPAFQAAAARAVGAWKLENSRDALNHMALDRSLGMTLRRAAIDGLAWLGGSGSRDTLLQLCHDDQDLAIRKLALVQLTLLDLEAAAQQAIVWLADAGTENPADVVTAFLQRKGGPEALVAALSEKTLPTDVVKLALRAVRSTARDHHALEEALARTGGLGTPAAPPTAEQVSQLVNIVLEQGDPSRGQQVFRREDLACMKCHAIAGSGGRVGPDLSSIGASAQIDYLVESLLVPGKAVKEAYHSLIVETDEGQIMTGIQVRRDDQELVLRDAEDRESVIPVGAIEEESIGGSIMPVGLVDSLTQAELVDLVRFLSMLGKPGEFAVGNQPRVRTWHVLVANKENEHAMRHGSFQTAAKESDVLTWQPAYSLVSGELPIEELPRITSRGDVPVIAVVEFELVVSTPGEIALGFDVPEGLAMWIDGEPVVVEERVSLKLERGRHRVTLVIEVDRRDEALRCRLLSIPESPARAQLVGGK